MGSIHQELYEALNARLYADRIETGGLMTFSTSSTSGFLRGGIDRDFDSSRSRNRPNAAIATTIDSEAFSTDGIAAICTAKVTVTFDRDIGFAQADAVIARMLAKLNNTEWDDGNSDRVCFVDFTSDTTAQTTTTAAADILYRVSSAKRVGGGVVAVDGKEIKITETFQVVVSTKGPANSVKTFKLSDQSTVSYGVSGPLNLTNNSQTERYLTVGSVGDVIPVGVPVPGNLGNYTLARHVGREKQLTKDCAVWVVQFSPIQVNFDKPIPRSTVSVAMEELGLVAWKFVASATPGEIYYVPYYTKVFRASTTRSEMIVKRCDEEAVQVYQNNIAANVGKVKEIDGVYHIFTGANIEYDLATSTLLIRANFWSNGPVKAWTQDPNDLSGPPFDVPSPALGPLMEFSVRKPSVNEADPNGALRQPSVKAVPLSSLLEPGDFTWITA